MTSMTATLSHYTFNQFRSSAFGLFDIALIINTAYMSSYFMFQNSAEVFMVISIIIGFTLCFGAIFFLWVSEERDFIRFLTASLSLAVISLALNLGVAN
nr:hypothetical protein [Vibrio splendidus]MCC4881848.1 hypothetical protein [Vibrio splendidus]